MCSLQGMPHMNLLWIGFKDYPFLFENYVLRGNKPVTFNNSGKETDLLFYYNFLEAADFHKDKDKDGYDTVQLYLIRDCRLVPIKMKLPE